MKTNVAQQNEKGNFGLSAKLKGELEKLKISIFFLRVSDPGISPHFIFTKHFIAKYREDKRYNDETRKKISSFWNQVVLPFYTESMDWLTKKIEEEMESVIKDLHLFGKSVIYADNAERIVGKVAARVLIRMQDFVGPVDNFSPLHNFVIFKVGKKLRNIRKVVDITSIEASAKQVAVAQETNLPELKEDVLARKGKRPQSKTVVTEQVAVATDIPVGVSVPAKKATAPKRFTVKARVVGRVDVINKKADPYVFYKEDGFGNTPMARLASLRK